MFDDAPAFRVRPFFLHVEIPCIGPSVLTGNPAAATMPDQEDDMEDNKKEKRLSLDWSTVIVAFALTALVLLGLPAIPW